MSRRNSREERKLNLLRKTIRKGRLPKHINLVDFAKDRKWSDTSGGVMQLIQENRIVSESHPLGRKVVTVGEGEDQKKVSVLDPIVGARLRPTIQLLPKKES